MPRLWFVYSFHSEFIDRTSEISEIFSMVEVGAVKIVDVVCVCGACADCGVGRETSPQPTRSEMSGNRKTIFFMPAS